MIDPRIAEAIRLAAKAAGQDEGLSEKLIRWMEDLAAGKEQLDDRDARSQRLERLFAATIVSPSDNDTSE